MIGHTRVAVFFYIFMAAAGAVWMWWRGDVLGEVFLAPKTGILMGSGIGIAAGLLIVLISDRFLERFSWVERLRREVTQALGPMDRTAAILLALLSGLGEEILFRGALLPMVGLFPAAVAFGLVHYGGPGLRWWMAFAFLAGLLFGVLFEVTGGLLAPVLAHVVTNGIQLHRLEGKGAVIDGDPGF